MCVVDIRDWQSRITTNVSPRGHYPSTEPTYYANSQTLNACDMAKRGRPLSTLLWLKIHTQVTTHTHTLNDLSSSQTRPLLHIYMNHTPAMHLSHLSQCYKWESFYTLSFLKKWSFYIMTLFFLVRNNPSPLPSHSLNTLSLKFNYPISTFIPIALMKFSRIH